VKQEGIVQPKPYVFVIVIIKLLITRAVRPRTLDIFATFFVRLTQNYVLGFKGWNFLVAIYAAFSAATATAVKYRLY